MRPAAQRQPLGLSPGTKLVVELLLLDFTGLTLDQLGLLALVVN